MLLDFEADPQGSPHPRGDFSTVDTVDFPSPEASDIHPPVDATIPPDE